MTRFLYSVTASADGFIAGLGGDMSWMRDFLGSEPDPIFARVIPQITALLSGRTTYDGDDPHAGDPDKAGAFEGQWEGPQIVLTHRSLEAAPAGVAAAHTFDDAVAASRRAAGDAGTVNVLGADVARQCLLSGVLDEILICTVPVLLGRGTPILRTTETSHILETIDCTSTAGATTSHYRVLGSR